MHRKERKKKKNIQVQVRIMEQEMCAMLLMNYKNCYQIYTITDYLQPEAHTRPFITVCDSSGYKDKQHNCSENIYLQLL